MKARLFLILSVGGVLLIVWTAREIYHDTRPRVVGRAVAPNGTEMCVVQEFNWSPEPFTTSFVYRKPSGQWDRFYYDHQDNFWGESPAVVDPATQTAVFYRDGKPAVTFAWATTTYTLHRHSRVETEASTLPVGWLPTQSIYQR